MELSVVGIDLAKSVFQLHGNDARGKAVLKKKLRRSELMPFVANLPRCQIAMEACAGSNHWAREFRKLGHEVALIAPQFVKPFVRTNKTDAADAEAIAEAAVRPNMRFVPVKEVWQQELLALHRVRDLLVSQRVQLTNAMRGLLHEHGIVMPQGDSQLQKKWLQIRENLSGLGLSESFTSLIQGLFEQYRQLSERIELLDGRIEKAGREHESCQRLQKIPGIGPLTATAVVASVGDARAFKSGRQFSAWVGLVPRQHSSGGKQQLLGISKRGDAYLRRLLVHGARAVVQFAPRRVENDYRARWVMQKVESRGKNKAVVALANHNARVIWALLARHEEYRAPSLAA
jgi:transposase